jgi:hypothetical protein
MRAWQKGQTRQPEIPSALRNEAAVTAVVPDNEKQCDENAIGHTEHHIRRQGKICDGAKERCEIQQRVNREDSETSPQGTRIDGARAKLGELTRRRHIIRWP